MPNSAEKMRSLRRELGWSQRRLAEELGVPTSTVGTWETNRIIPSSTYASRIRELRIAAGLESTSDDARRIRELSLAAGPKPRSNSNSSVVADNRWLQHVQIEEVENPTTSDSELDPPNSCN